MTLIEMIVTLVILATLLTVPTLMIPDVINGMRLARNEAAAAENIQAAITRITHEVANMDTKRAYTFAASSITYFYRNNVATSTIGVSGSNLQLNGNTLLNNLAAGGFTVQAPNYGVNPAVPVRITLVVNVPSTTGTVTKTYAFRISLNTQRHQ